MPSTEQISVVNIIAEVCSAMQVPDGLGGFLSINYQPGRTIQIIKSLAEKDNSSSLKDTKYPLITLSVPYKINKSELGFYGVVKIDKIIIATFSNGTDPVYPRFQPGGTFYSVLYPCYNEFLNQLGRHKNIVTQDPGAFKHTQSDVPAIQPLGQGLPDYVDYIEIANLELSLVETKNCK